MNLVHIFLELFFLASSIKAELLNSQELLYQLGKKNKLLGNS